MSAGRREQLQRMIRRNAARDVCRRSCDQSLRIPYFVGASSFVLPIHKHPCNQCERDRNGEWFNYTGGV